MRPGSALALEGQLVLCTGSRVNLLSQTFELGELSYILLNTYCKK